MVRSATLSTEAATNQICYKPQGLARSGHCNEAPQSSIFTRVDQLLWPLLISWYWADGNVCARRLA